MINKRIWETSSSASGDSSSSEEPDSLDKQKNSSIVPNSYDSSSSSHSSILSSSSSSSNSSNSSKKKSLPENSTEMNLLNLTPDLQFMNSPNTPQEALIRNEDHYGFLNFTQATDREELQK